MQKLGHPGGLKTRKSDLDKIRDKKQKSKIKKIMVTIIFNKKIEQDYVTIVSRQEKQTQK